MNTLYKISLANVFSLLTLVSHSSAADRNWSNADLVNGGEWHTPLNWSTGTIPTAATTAAVDNGGLAVITGADAVVSPGNFWVGETTLGNRLIIANHTLTTGNIDIGSGIMAEGTITIRNGAKLQTNGHSSGTFRRMFLGDNGKGTLNIEAGGTLLTGGDTRLANAAGSQGAALVEGIWEHVGDAAIGFNGTASLTISGAGRVKIGGLLTMGAGNNAVAALNIGGSVSTGGIASTPTSAGRLEVSTIRGGASHNLAGGRSTINFNHTDSRYEFADTEGTAIVITQNTYANTNVNVNVLAGTTVLKGASSYKGGTRISGGMLLANYTGAGANESSTGTGEVVVEAEGTLG